MINAAYFKLSRYVFLAMITSRHKILDKLDLSFSVVLLHTARMLHQSITSVNMHIETTGMEKPVIQQRD